MKKFFAILFLGIIVLAGRPVLADSCVENCYSDCVGQHQGDTSALAKCQPDCETSCKINPIDPPAETPAATAPAAAASNNSNNSSNNGIAIKNPLGGDATIPQLANRFISVALGLSGILALIAFIYGGVMYLTAGINPKNVDTGKKVMIWAVAGLFLIFSSYAIVNFILKDILGIK